MSTKERNIEKRIGIIKTGEKKEQENQKKRRKFEEKKE